MKQLSPRPPHKKDDDNDDDDDDDDDDDALAPIAASGLDYFGSSWTPGKRSGSRQGELGRRRRPNGATLTAATGAASALASFRARARRSCS